MATIVGLFRQAEDARTAVEHLRGRGTPLNAVSMVAARDAEEAGEGEAAREAEKGALVGGLAGLMLGLTEITVPGVGPLLAGGWLVTTLLGAGVGAVSGGLIGALTDAGMAHEEAHRMQEGVMLGGALVTVRAADADIPRITDMLTRHHAATVQAIPGDPVETMGDVTMQPNTLNGDSFVCPRCDAVFATEKDLQDHIRSHVTSPHGAEYVCTACGATYNTEAELNAHSRVHMAQDQAA